MGITETKARKIIAANARPALGYGMAGCRDVFALATDPRTFKRKAAETLAYISKNRAACKAQGRQWVAADARLLEHAAWCRKRIAELKGK